MEFPHLNDSSFPNIGNVDVYKHKVEFDYSRWVAGTKYKLCNVNYCSDYDNVVKYSDDTERDSYFDALDGFEDTLISEMRMQDEFIKVPLPFDVCKRYNYIIADYPIATPDGTPIDYESTEGKRRFFFFIMDTEYQSPNCTKLELKLDVWTTYINDVSIPYMMLERGHAPLYESPLNLYLENPSYNSMYLCAPDVDFGNGAKAMPQSFDYVLNKGDMCAIFVCTGEWGAEWGSGNTIQTPCDPAYYDGFSGSEYQLIAVMEDKYHYFVDYMSDEFPHWIQTIKGIYLLPKSLFDFEQIQGVTGCSVYRPIVKRNLSLGKLYMNEIDLRVPEQYRNLTKLYTFPYSWIEVSDGISTKAIRIEECRGKIDLDLFFNAVFPYMNAYALLRGIGGDSSTVTFKQIGEKEFQHGGFWYDYRIDLKVPCYAILQSGANHIEYASKYDRIQAQNNADLITTQANLRIAANEDICDYQNTYNYNMLTNSALKQGASFAMTQAASGINFETGMTNNMVSLASNTISGAASGATVGALAGGGIGAAGGAIASGLISFAGSSFSLVTSASNNSAAIDKTRRMNGDYLRYMFGGIYDESQVSGFDRDEYADVSAAWVKNNPVFPFPAGMEGQATGYGTSLNSNLTSVNNDLTEDNAAASKSNAEAAISNGVKQRSLDSPFIFGSDSQGETVSTEPIGVYVNVCRENDFAIRAAGDEFARYGYMLNQAWQVSRLTLMKYFTYWKASDLWISGAKGVIENAQESIKAIFKQGVTVWKSNDDIGSIPIHANH